MFDDHFIPFDVLSHSKILDVDMLTSTSTFIILREENGTRLSQKILIALVIESTILRPPTKFLNHNAYVVAL